MKNRFASMLIGGVIGVLVTSIVFSNFAIKQSKVYEKISSSKHIIVVPDVDSFFIVVDKESKNEK